MIFRIEPSLIAGLVAFTIFVWLLIWNIMQGYRMNYLQAEILRLRGRINSLELHMGYQPATPAFLQAPPSQSVPQLPTVDAPTAQAHLF